MNADLQSVLNPWCEFIEKVINDDNFIRTQECFDLIIDDLLRERKAVAELIAAAQPFARRNCSEPSVPVSLSTEDVTRLRTALASLGGF